MADYIAVQELVENAENRMDVLQRETNLLPHIFDTLKHPDSRVRAEFIGHVKPCVTEIYLRKIYLMRARPIISTLGHTTQVRKQGAWTLEKLGKEDLNKLIMLSGTNLQRLLSLLSNRNPEMR